MYSPFRRVTRLRSLTQFLPKQNRSAAHTTGPRWISMFACVLLLACAASAQTWNKQTYSSGPWPNGVKTADVNRDGNLDLLWISSFHNLEVRLGGAGGSFSSITQTFDFGTRSGGCGDVCEFEIADLNRDGIPDAIGAGGGEISVMLGRGDGAFGPNRRFGGTSADPEGGFNSLALADFNRDGKLDAISSNVAGVQLFFGNGDGTFKTPPKIYAAESSALNSHSVEAGDFDGDGNADIVFWNCCRDGSSTADFRVWYGDGLGQFPTKTILSSMISIPQFFVRDLNADGRADITAVTQCYIPGCSAAAITWLASTSRTFVRRIQSVAGIEWLAGLGFGDFDRNGVLDLATVGQDTISPSQPDRVYIFKRRADGTFSGVTSFSIPTSNSNPDPEAIVSGDFNKDSRPDLALSLRNDDVIQVWLNTTGTSATCSPGALYTVHLCVPVNDSTVPSPVQISAYARSDTAIVAWKVYVDGVVKREGSGANIQTSMTLGAYTYQRRITVKAWDAGGHVFWTTVYVTVR